MKKFTLLKSLLVVMALSLFSFSAIAEEVTLSFANKANRTEFSSTKQVWVDNTTSPKITFTNAKASSTNAVADYSNPVRCYAKSSITIETNEGFKITKLVVKCNNSSYATALKNSISSGASVSGNDVTVEPAAQTYNIASLSAQVRINSIVATIEIDDATANNPSISAPNVAFGILSATNATKTITVTGANLTNAITATLKTGTAFELSGDLTKDGGDLTVKFIATAAGTYSDEITLTSGETTKAIEVSATLVATEGNGTKENPYTCADVKLLNNSLASGKYWVKGYILGSLADNKIAETNVNSNLALGATADAKDFVPVQLPSGNVRTALNLVDNPTLLGREVLVYGNFENYFSKPGVKNVTDYVILEAQGGDDEQVEATAIALNKTTASLEQYREELLVATLTPAEATTQIVWTSSNEEIATVTDGLVKAIAIGEATITAKAGELTATCVVTVSEATVLTCAQAAEMALKATANNVNVEGGQYVVSGYVTEIAYAYSAEYDNMSVWIADTKEGGKVFELYKVKPLDGVIPVVGDSVVAVGYLTKYNTTPEMAAGCVCRVIKNEGPATSVENTKLADIYTLNRTIVAEGEFQIFTVTGQNVTDMNGNLEKGIYVVRTTNATAKVVIK